MKKALAIVSLVLSGGSLLRLKKRPLVEDASGVWSHPLSQFMG